MRTFAAAAGALARADQAAALRGMLQRIQGTVTPDEWDEVQPAACVVYADRAGAPAVLESW